MQKRVEFMSFELLIQSLSDTASGRFCADLAHSDLPPHIKSFKGDVKTEQFTLAAKEFCILLRDTLSYFTL